jgi:site-specific recombinase XerD
MVANWRVARPRRLPLPSQRRKGHPGIQAVCALRFLYSNTLHLAVSVDHIPLPRYEKRLPVILSPAEVKLLLEAPQDLEYRTILSTMYAAGTRISEVAQLRVPDIDSGRGVIWVRGAGQKLLRNGVIASVATAVSFR